MAFNGDTAERIGTALKNTELASKVSGPDENGVYTYSMEVSLPRENGENYFLVGCTVNDGDACVYNLAQTAMRTLQKYITSIFLRCPGRI